MPRPFSTTSTRRKRTLAVCAVLFATAVVPPAFGADSVAKQVSQALKLAKRADKNATKAVKLAKTASSSAKSAGTSGANGTNGAAGERGPQGAAGATGDTGPAGPQGAAGAKGDKGDTGATGAQGPQGPKGDPGAAAPGGGAPAAVSVRLEPAALATDFGNSPLAYVAADATKKYVINVHAQVSNTGPTASSYSNATCEARTYVHEAGGVIADSSVIDSFYLDPMHQNVVQSASLTGLAAALPTALPAGDEYRIGIWCKGSTVAMTAGASLTAITVS